MPRAKCPTTLYRHYDADGTLLYVGVSMTLLWRLTKHRKGSRWWRQVATIKVEHFDTRAAALAAELRAIKEERPKFNTHHNTRPWLTSQADCEWNDAEWKNVLDRMW